MASDLIKQLSDASFEADVFKSSTPCWSTTGPVVRPLQDDRPILDDVAGCLPGHKLTVAKMNVDETARSPPKFGIRGIPTLMLFRTASWPPPRLAPW